MLYNLLYPLSVDYSIINIFKYITFRSAWALVTALAVSILVGLISPLAAGHQVPSGNPQGSEGAPVQGRDPHDGGLLIVFAVSVSVLLWAT